MGTPPRSASPSGPTALQETLTAELTIDLPADLSARLPTVADLEAELSRSTLDDIESVAQRPGDR